MELIYDVAKYSMPCHGIFCHITYVICWGINNDILILNILSFLVQPMLQISRAFIQYLQYFQNCWNDEKLHAWKIFDEFKLINILVLWQTCVVMVRYYSTLHNKTLYMKARMTVNKIIANQMYEVLSSHIFWCHTISV